jgi:transcription antitermination factor NusG
MAIDTMQSTDVGTNLPVAPHEQNHKHGAPEHSDQRAGWYILRCGGGLDFKARDALVESGWATFVPIERKWHVTLLRRQVEASYPRYPGYLFARIAPPLWPPLTKWPLNRYLRGVLALGGQPVPLAPGEMERLQAEDGAAVESRAAPLHRAFVAGQAVRVLGGPFQDFEVRIDAIDGAGAHLTVQIFGRPTAVKLPLTWLGPA